MIGAAVLAFAAWTSLSFLGGIAFLDFLRPSIQSLTGFTSSRDAVDALSGSPLRLIRAWLADEEVPRLHLDIKYKHLHKLHQKRDEAMAKGLLESPGGDFVPAEIRVGEPTVRRDSRVRIEDSLFQSNRCGDALNLVRSEFKLINVRFLDTPSDAFDGDFVNGRIVGGSYQDIGGDGIDVSGATVSIEDVELRRIHDKALSIGERSQASISGVHIDDAGTAIASKDASRTEISNSEFSRIHFTAVMAYVKKPEFGPSVVIARDVILKEVGREALAQLGSQVTLNGVELEPEAIDIEELYERGHMRK